MGNLRLIVAMLVLVITASTTSAHAQTVLYDFGSHTGDPIDPELAYWTQGRDGNLYSTSPTGGSNGDGAAFYYSFGTGLVTLVHSFVGSDGSAPYGGLILATDGNLYGTTSAGGAHGVGTVFQIKISGNTFAFKTLYSFANGPDGGTPYAPPVEGNNGSLYGTTATGGGAAGCGTVYSISTSGTQRTLHSFAGSSGSDGCTPMAPLALGNDGNLYGTTNMGGTSSYQAGTIFRITPSGAIALLHNFGDVDGYEPNGLILGNDGFFYGTTAAGGKSGLGVVFRITAAGSFTVLYNFKGGKTDGAQPYTALVQATNGELYGVTTGGGATGAGAIFGLRPVPFQYSLLHSFVQSDSGDIPEAPLIQRTDGLLYGDTFRGGAHGEGTFFSLNLELAPFINLSTYSGTVGSTVGIFGLDFDSASVVKFNGVAATKITLSGTTYITATVPAGAADGKVTVTTGTTTLSSTKNFIVHNTWSKGAGMPTAVQGPAAGFIGGKFYVVGGATNTVITSDNQVYNPTTNAWTAANAIPTPVWGAASAVVNGILYVFGGYTSAAASNEVQAYNPVTNKWTTKAAMPTARGSAAAVVDGISVYVIGGNGSTLRLSTVEKYNTITNTWTEEAPLLVGKSETSAGLVGTTIVAADGYTTSADTGDNEAYNASTNNWSAETSDPKPRNATCSGAISGQFYVAGGGNDGTPGSTNEAFSTTTNKWTTLLSMPQAVIFPSSAIANGQLYCFGGSNTGVQFKGTVYNYVQVYQP